MKTITVGNEICVLGSSLSRYSGSYTAMDTDNDVEIKF